MRRTIRVENFYEEDFVSDDSDYAKAEEVVQWILSKFMEIPPEYKSVAEFRIKQLGCGVGVEFVYHRTETDEEYTQRMNAASEQVKRRKEKDLKRLKRIAAKYGLKITTEE
jgi:predicted HAD superfamily Cof-like phosphohydrolase